MERVSSYGLNQTLMSSALSVQSRYSASLTQQASGMVAENYAELGSNAARLISLEATTSRLTTWSDNTQLASDRVQSMYSAVGDMADLLTSLRSEISAAMSDATSEGADMSDTGKDTLSDLAQLMNLQQDGRYLFAGSSTDTAPVDTSLLAAATVPSTADTSYYQGDDQTASVRVSEQQTISYGVTADGTAFEQALRSANILASTNPLDQTALTEAYDLATSALDGLLAVQSGLSITSNRLDSALSSQDATLSLTETMTSGIKDVDVAEISLKVNSYETQLQASYSALGKINKLSLTQYL